MLFPSALVIGSLVATHYCRAARDRYVDDGKSGRVPHLFAQGATDVLIPFAGVAALYLLLTIRVDLADSSAATVEDVARLEAGIGAAARWLKELKLGVGSTLGVLVVCLAASVWLRRRGYDLAAAGAQSAQKSFERSQKSARALAGVVTLVSAFTLFSAHAEATQKGRLELRLKCLEEEHRALVDSTSAVIEEALSLELARRVYEHTPADVLRAGQAWSADRRARREVVREYEYVSKRYDFSWAHAEELRAQLQRAAAVREELDESISSAHRSSAEAQAELRSGRARVPARSSEALLQELRGRLGAYPADGKTFAAAAAVFDDELAKQIIPKLVALLLDRRHSQLTALAAEEVPLLEPLLEVGSGAVSGRLAAWIQDKARAQVQGAIGGRRFDREAVEAAGRGAAAQIVIPPWEAATLATRVDTVELETRALRAGLLERTVHADRAAEAELRRENEQIAARIRAKWPPDDLQRMTAAQRIAAAIRPSSPEPLLAEIRRRDVLAANALLCETEQALGGSFSGLSDIATRYALPAPARAAIQDVLSRRPLSEAQRSWSKAVEPLPSPQTNEPVELKLAEPEM